MLLLELRVIWSILFFLEQINGQDLKSSCYSPSVYKGQTASVTCVFGEDLRIRHIDFRIYRQTVVVLDCYWGTASEVASLQCDQVPPGYSFDDFVSTKATLTIINATEQFIGEYQCQPTSNDFRNPEKCEFKLIEGTQPRSVTSTANAVDVQTKVIPFDTPEAPTDKSSTTPVDSDDDNNKAEIFAPVGVIGLILVVAAILCCIFRKRIKQRLPCLRRKPTTDDVNGQIKGEPADGHPKDGVDIHGASFRRDQQYVELISPLNADSSEAPTDAENGHIEGEPVDRHLEDGAKIQGASNHQDQQDVELKPLLMDDEKAVANQMQPVENAEPKGDATPAGDAARKRETTPELMEDLTRVCPTVQIENNPDSSCETVIPHSKDSDGCPTPTAKATPKRDTPLKDKRKNNKERFVTASEFPVPD